MGGPGSAMVPAGEVRGEGRGVLTPSGSQTIEVSATDAQEVSRSVSVEVAAVESVEGLVKEPCG